MVLVEFGDFACDFCARATGVMKELSARFGDDLTYVFRHLPQTHVHPWAETAAEAAEAAGAQGKFWEMHDLLFDHPSELEVPDLLGYAGRLGLDVERFARDLEERTFASRVRADVASAEVSGASGTPTFFVGGRRHTGPWDAETLAARLEGSRTQSGTPDPARLPSGE
jgi:protein-disulfide isomerase